MQVGGQHDVPAALPPRMTRYPLHSRLGGPQGRCGTFRPHRYFIPGPSSPQRVATPTELSRPGPSCRCLAKSTYPLSYRLQERVLTVTFAIRHAGIYKEQCYSMSPPTMNVLQQIHTKIKASKFFHCPTVICHESNVYSDENFPSYIFSSLQFVHLNKS